jgi:tRNA dimethylallyltransferase
MKRLIVITGPTGAGKTDLSIAVAQRLGVPIVSADSRQVFEGMAIGTAQPTAEQLAAVPHHFIASHKITEHYTCGRYAEEALALLDKLFAEHDEVVVVGGSGLYIDALTDGVDEMPVHDPELRARLREMPLEELVEQLRELDPAYYEQVDRRNPQRVVRAVEVSLQTGRPYSELRTGRRAARGFEVVKIGVDMPRAALYERIDRRVDAMMAAGLEAEARALYPHRALGALQTVGYRELFEYFDGKITLAEAVELIKRNSRRYAKRQLTWLRRDASLAWFGPTDVEGVISRISSSY